VLILSCAELLVFVQEVDLGIVPDLGTLQRLPKIVGNDSVVREFCYTARPMNANEAHLLGLVRCVCLHWMCCDITHVYEGDVNNV